MKRPAGFFSIRLDIVGIDPRLFSVCRQNEQAVVQSRTKNSARTTTSETQQDPPPPELLAVPKDRLALYARIVSITIDFERAYGRGVEVRVFEKSPNRFLNSLLLRRKSRTTTANSEPQEEEQAFRPTFYVNGVKVFTGVPNSFSELDEAIDKSFGRRDDRAGF